MSKAIPIRLLIRADDVDANRHARGATFVNLADHARWELVRRAGISLDELARLGLGPVNLETTIKFAGELRVGDEIDIVTEFEYGPGKTSIVRQQLLETSEGRVVGEVTSISGLLDLNTRRLVPEPAGRWRALATAPELLGL